MRVKSNAYPGEGRGPALYKRIWTPAFAGVLLAFSAAAGAQPNEPSAHDRAIAAGYKALFLCSGIFNAGRTHAQVEALELTGIYPQYQELVSTLPAKVLPSRVSVEFDPALPPRLATWSPGLGCRALPIGARSDSIATPEAKPSVAPLDSRSWPMGDRGVAPRPSAALESLAGRAFDGASFGKGSRTTGLVIVHDGRVIGERYMEGFGPTTSSRTWSVAKSISGTLAGIAVAQKLVRADEPALVPEWRAVDFDPRARITLDQLLRMASGLHSDTAGNRTDALYTGATAVTQEAAHWPLETAPGARFRYANNDTLLAIRSIRAAMHDDQRYWRFPREALFERIGMRHTVAETDWQGNFILSSQVWSTARDLARLGLLWLNDGVWEGERILPEGWMTYMTTPSGPQPEGDGPGYGATLWLFGEKQGLPAGSYAAQGNRGQFVMVVPSKRLVIVRRGEDPAGARFDTTRFTADVIAALE